MEAYSATADTVAHIPPSFVAPGLGRAEADCHFAPAESAGLASAVVVGFAAVDRSTVPEVALAAELVPDSAAAVPAAVAERAPARQAKPPTRPRKLRETPRRISSKLLGGISSNSSPRPGARRTLASAYTRKSLDGSFWLRDASRRRPRWVRIIELRQPPQSRPR